MNDNITIIFAYRNRDAQRVKLAFRSLREQSNSAFEVLFIDYGSDEAYATVIKEVVEQFSFASYHYIAHPGLLWNKSKALNYGIRLCKTAYILTADVDLLFTAAFIETCQRLKSPQHYSLFKIGYLSEANSKKQKQQLDLNNTETTFIGQTFGVGLYPKLVLEKVGGLDEFFHFYGSEDADLNSRIELAGLELKMEERLLLYHLWHPRYPRRKDHRLTVVPRLSNVMRINQRHFLRNQVLGQSIHEHAQWGRPFMAKDYQVLQMVTETIKLSNIKAHVEHFFQEELPKRREGVLLVEIVEDDYFGSLKYHAKKLLGKISQPYMTMKAVNDFMLQQIVFHYREFNYSFKVDPDLKKIALIIDLNSHS